MSSSDLSALWDAATSQPYYPAVPKHSQFAVGFILLLTGMDISVELMSVEQSVEWNVTIANSNYSIHPLRYLCTEYASSNRYS